MTHDAGMFMTTDHGQTSNRVSLPIGQMYHVAVDNDVPYRIYGNMQDDGTMRGLSTTQEAGPNVPGQAQAGGGRGGRGGGGGGRGGFGGLGGGNTGKRYNFTVTASARNAFNHENLAIPSGILSSPFFGVSTALNNGGGAGFGGNNGAAGNRKVEIQLRFQF